MEGFYANFCHNSVPGQESLEQGLDITGFGCYEMVDGMRNERQIQYNLKSGILTNHLLNFVFAGILGAAAIYSGIKAYRESKKHSLNTDQ